MTLPGQVAVDIVVTNHNYGSYVCDAIDSARRQEHPSVNVVVVDDGSTDCSRERLRTYEGAVDLVLKENGGQASAFNAGFSRCRGDAVIFLDADDLLAPIAASLGAMGLADEPGASRVQFRMGLIDGSGHPLGATRPEAGRAMAHGDLRRAELAFPFDLCWAPGGGNVFRADALRRIMPIPEAEYGRWGADYYLVHLTALLGTVVSLPDVGAYYRVHGANAFQPATSTLDLDRVRREIFYQQRTVASLAQLADWLGLDRPDPILSLSSVALRIISRKLAPDRHPVADDRISALMLDALRAAGRRYDVAVPLRVAMVAALGAIAASPRPIASKLAEQFVFPEHRARLMPLIRRLQREPAAKHADRPALSDAPVARH